MLSATGQIRVLTVVVCCASAACTCSGLDKAHLDIQSMHVHHAHYTLGSITVYFYMTRMLHVGMAASLVAHPLEKDF